MQIAGSSSGKFAKRSLVIQAIWPRGTEDIVNTGPEMGSTVQKKHWCGLGHKVVE